MNFDFSDEQLMLREQGRRFLSERCDTRAVRRILEGEQAYDATLWTQMAELGWLAIGLPEQHGGFGGAYELCVLAEELGRSLAPVPAASTLYLAARALTRAGSDEQQGRWLPAVAAGRAIGAWAVHERPGSQRRQPVGSFVSAGKLHGCKTPVADGAFADFAIVTARATADASAPVGLFIADLRHDSVRRAALGVVDPTRPCATLEFHGTPVESLGETEQVATVVDELTDGAAALLAFEQLGGAEVCLAMARDFALERKAFGRVIGSFQAVKHRLADMWVKIQLARGNAYYAAWALDAAGDELPAAAAAARIASTDAYEFASQESIQIHGGMGYTWEADCHLYYRRSRSLALMLGAPREWKERLAAQLVQRVRGETLRAVRPTAAQAQAV